MSHRSSSHRSHARSRSGLPSPRRARTSRSQSAARPASAHQHRGDGIATGCSFDAPETWHEPQTTAPQSESHSDHSLKIIVSSPGAGYLHPVSPDDVRERVLQLPQQYQRALDVVQFSRMTRKRRLFPCYGLQWGSAVYLYPIEESLAETYVRAPRPAQRIETEMFGGRWVQDGHLWRLVWTHSTIRDFYLNNVLIHEIGHINDQRNTSFRKRERFADWFAVEYGYRHSRGRSARN